jgi:acetoacetyl-CoA synthetase
VGPDDHFLDLGGTSLHAAQVLSRLRRLTGCRLPLASLLRAPTPRQLAELALGMRSGPVADRASSHPLWVTLRPGQGRPLVLVHGLSGTVMECWPAVQALRGPRPVVGLQARGLDGGSLPPLRVEAIAADYVEALRSEQPQGPYALCGFSFGGVVALEMARLLCARGEQVELLALIDPYLRRGLPAWSRWWLRGRALSTRLARMDGADRLRWLRGTCARLLRAAVGLGQGPERAPPGELAVSAPRGSARQRAVRARLEACLDRYTPAPFAACPVLFVRTSELLPGYFDPMPVWRRVLHGPLSITQLDGPHLDIVRTQASALAGVIDAALAEAAPPSRAEDYGAGEGKAGADKDCRKRSAVAGSIPPQASASGIV